MCPVLVHILVFHKLQPSEILWYKSFQASCHILYHVVVARCDQDIQVAELANPFGFETEVAAETCTVAIDLFHECFYLLSSLAITGYGVFCCLHGVRSDIENANCLFAYDLDNRDHLFHRSWLRLSLGVDPFHLE